MLEFSHIPSSANNSAEWHNCNLNAGLGVLQCSQIADNVGHTYSWISPEHSPRGCAQCVHHCILLLNRNSNLRPTDFMLDLAFSKNSCVCHYMWFKVCLWAFSALFGLDLECVHWVCSQTCILATLLASTGILELQPCCKGLIFKVNNDSFYNEALNTLHHHQIQGSK